MDARRILIVEDEAPIRDGLVDLFAAKGARVSAARDGAEAMDQIDSFAFDLIVLDLMIPPPDGLTVLRRLRASGVSCPVLVLTARDSEDDIVEVIDAGADDYMTKPFGIRELVARAKGLLRRAANAPAYPPEVRFGPCTVDLVRGEARVSDDHAALTDRETRLLRYLVTTAPATASREALLTDVWGYRDGRVRTRTVDVHVQQLRARLRALGAPEIIETVRGAGYRVTTFEPTG